MRLFLRAHRARLALVGIVEPRLLVDGAALLEDFDLAPRLVLDRLADEGDRVHVLDLAAGAERRAGLAHGDVDVGAQRPLLHVAVAGAEIAQDRAQLGHIGLGLLGVADVGLGHDLHQRHAAAVEIDMGHRRRPVVQQLAGVLLQMQPLDADGRGLAAVELDDHLALADDRRLVLADLVALRRVRIEIVLPVEHRAQVDLCVQPQPGPDSLSDAFLVDDRQHARHRRVHQRHMAVRLAAERSGGAREQF